MRCTGCGHSNSDDARFCNQCAYPLTGDATPRGLVHERKQVSVLFADMKDSMGLLAGRDPEEARSLLDPVLEILMAAVRQQDGTVNQVMGDGIMALFGAPHSQEDHSLRACRAALRMQAELAHRSSAAAGAVPALPVQVRVGIHSGEVVVRTIDSGLHFDYTAVGETTHLAARMEQAARPGSILITASTLLLTRGAVLTRPLGALPIAGLPGAVDVHEVVGLRADTQPFSAMHARPLGAFIGRSGDLDGLRDALDAARRGEGGMTLLVGDAGIGKSRLLHEFVQGLQARGWRTLAATCAECREAGGYRPLAELLRQALEARAQDDAQALRERVEARFAAPLPAPREHALALCALLDALPADSPWARMALGERRQAIVDALAQLLVRESRMAPLAVLIEDLQHIDPDSRAVLDALLEPLREAALPLLASCRPEAATAWQARVHVQVVPLDRLPEASARELVQALLGRDAGTRALQDIVLEQADGNPLFIEESVAALAQTGVVIGAPGAYRAGRTLQRLKVPDTVHAILATRIDSLDGADKALLQAAAVLGKRFSAPLLGHVACMAEAPLQSALERLAQRDLVRGQPLSDAWSFRHPLTHEVAYGTLLTERRRALHARAVEAIEREHGERLDEHAEALAHHAVLGGLGEPAVGHLRHAAARALHRSANRDAIAFLEQARAVFDSLPATRERQAERLRLCVQLVALRRETDGDATPEVERCASEGLALSEQLAESSCRGTLIEALWAGHHARGNEAAALAWAARWAEEAAPVDVAARERALEAHAVSTIAGGRPAEALAALAAAAWNDAGRSPERLACAAMVAVARWVVGQVDGARDAAERCVDGARTAGRSSAKALAHYAASIVHYQRGELGTALLHADAARRAGRDAAGDDIAAHASMIVARVRIEEGRTDDAVRLLADGPPDAGSDIWTWKTALSHALAADAWSRAGHPDRGLALLRDLTAERCTGLHGPELLRLRASLRVAVHPGAAEGAEAELRNALAIAQERDMHSLALRASISLAHLLAPRDRRAARAVLAVVDRFDEGAAAADVRKARVLREWLR